TTDALKDASRRLRAEESLAESSLTTLLPRLQAANDQPLAPSQARDDAAGRPETKSPPIPKDLRMAVPLNSASGAVRREHVRVSSANLDRMLDLGGELLIARRR